MRGVSSLKKDKNRERDRMRLERKLQKKWANTASRRFDRQNVRTPSAQLRCWSGRPQSYSPHPFVSSTPL